jgi:hypothetical protein
MRSRKITCQCGVRGVAFFTSIGRNPNEVAVEQLDNCTGSLPGILVLTGGLQGLIMFEQLDLQTGEILTTFPTAAAANIAFGKRKQSSNIQCGIRENRLSYGYFWRKVGTQTMPPALERKPLNRMLFEQLDPQTGEILTTFPTVAAANIALGKRKESSNIQCGIRENRLLAENETPWNYCTNLIYGMRVIIRCYTQ